MLNIELAKKHLGELMPPASCSNNEAEAWFYLKRFFLELETIDRRKCITRPAALLMPPVKGV